MAETFSCDTSGRLLRSPEIKSTGFRKEFFRYYCQVIVAYEILSISFYFFADYSKDQKIGERLETHRT